MKFINYILKFFGLELNYIEYDTDKNYNIDIDRVLAIHIYNKEITEELPLSEIDANITAMVICMKTEDYQLTTMNNLKQIENRLNEYL